MFHFCILLLFLFVAGDAVKLKTVHPPAVNLYPKDNGEGSLKPGGLHVCAFKESKTIYQSISTTIAKSYTVKECCKKFMWCWKHCKRPRFYYKTITKTISKMTTYDAYYCCSGWSFDSKTKQCSTPVCQPYCYNKGVCKEPGVCSCLPGYMGKYCQQDVDECASRSMNKCEQNCVNLPGSYQCQCKEGYTPLDERSLKCQDINECKTKPCHCGGGTNECCTNIPGSYNCECKPGYIGITKNRCVDVNECWNNPDICPKMSDCVNTPGSYDCKCIPGFKKSADNRRCVGVDICAKSNGGCEHDCHAITGGCICTCRSGYVRANQRSCNDINECKEVEPCDAETSYCVNTPGYYDCKCKGGFFMDEGQKICDDVDECKDETALCEHKCSNTFGSYTCSCKEGFKLATDGHKCADVDECKGRHFCSQKCVNMIGSYVCACNPGYMLDADKRRCHARQCEDIISPIFGQAVCDGFVVGKRCQFSCKEGYEISGPSERQCKTNGKWSGAKTVCKPKSCKPPNPPKNGKVTLPCDNSYGSTCPVSCVDGYILRGTDMIKCDIVYNRLQWDNRNTRCDEILVCKPNPCQNSGKCSIVTDTEYFCNCTNTGHTGKDCELLVVNHSPIPKLNINVRSPELTMSAKPIDSVTIQVYPEDPGIVYSTTKFDLKQPHTSMRYTIRSNVTGLKWVSYEVSSSEKVAATPDTLLFFGSQRPPSIPGFSLLSKNKDCYTVSAKPIACPSKVMKFSSTGWWENRPGNLVTTNGLIFADINGLKFPVSLSYVSAVLIFDDFRNAADLAIKTQPTSPTCKQSQLTEQELEYTIRNDVFTKDFLSQYNKVTPEWFSVEIGSSLQNIHRDNVQAFVWSGDRIKSEEACSGAAIDKNSLFLVYLLHEKLTMKVRGRQILMTTKDKFCLLIDVCTNEPHLVLPPDNYGTLETVFSFAEEQAMGWTLGVKSVGFRTSNAKDGRKCSNNNGTQVAFGNANMTYKYKTIIAGGMQGDMFLNVIQKKGKQDEIANLEQCFDGKSQFDTPTWFTTDNFHKRYTKPKPAHNEIRTKASKPSPKHNIFSVTQGKNSIFRMKTGLKPVLKTSNSGINLKFMYKEKKRRKTFGQAEEIDDDEEDEEDGDENGDPLNALETITLPLEDIIAALSDIEITSEPFKTEFQKFRSDLSKWDDELNDDIEKGEDHPDLLLSIVRKHYFKLAEVIIKVKNLEGKLKAHHVDPEQVKEVHKTLPDFELSLKDLKKYVTVEKPTKKFEYITLNFMGQMCLFSPCMDYINSTLYPMIYDLKLGDFCYEPGKDPNSIWQTELVVTKSQLKGNFFDFKHGDKLYFCLSVYGVRKGIINAAIKMLGTQIRSRYILQQDNTINISPRKIQMFNKYDFTVNSTVNLKLGNWDMVNIRSYGYANDGSQFTRNLQKYLETYAIQESKKMNTRYNDAIKTKSDLVTDTSVFLQMVNKDKRMVTKMEGDLHIANSKWNTAKKEYEDHRRRYDEMRDKMDKLEARVKNICTITECSSFCHKLPQCKLCQDPVVINKVVPSCHVELRDRSYGFMKSEKSVCSHQVADQILRYTGNCKNPNIDGKAAQAIIDRLNKKMNAKPQIPLTEEDAYDLQRLNQTQGDELLKKIEERDFFKNFGRRLKNGLITEEEFVRLAKYRNKTFADKMRTTMKKIKDSEFVDLIGKKLNASQSLTEEDYAKLRKIDPRLEKRIRASEAITDISMKIKVTGKISEEDMKKLRKVAPEYAKNITKALKGQEQLKECISRISKKMAKGTLSSADLKELERLNPDVAEKLKASLREQLKQKVKEVHGKLTTVKDALSRGLNSTGLIDLQKQLDTITGRVKPFTKKTLEELQKKIKAAAASSDKVFDQVLERLDLDYDIKNLTGSSQDLKRVLDNFFGVLTNVDVPTILKRNYIGVLNGLTNIQEWFHTLAKIVAQASEKCGSKCATDESLKTLLGDLKTHLGLFNNKLCTTKWITGYKLKDIADICTNLDLIEKFLNKFQTIKLNIRKEIKSNIEDHLITILDKWKNVRKEVSSSKYQWKKSKSTLSLLENFNHFATMVRRAYASELGKVKVSIPTGEEIILVTEKTLKNGQYTASMAQIELLNVVLKDLASSVQTLPAFIKQNGQTRVSVTTDEANQISESFKKIVDRIIPSLKALCTDKSPPDKNPIPRLITLAEPALLKMLRSKTLNDLFTNSNRFYQFAKVIPQTMEKVKSSMLPCKLREEKIKSDEKIVEDVSVKGLKEFLSSVKPLSIKSAKEMMKELDGLMEEYKDGIKSPIGKLVDNLLSYIDRLPKFNIAMMVSLTPKLSVVVLNTFQESIAYIENIFAAMNKIIERCTKCKPEDIFGKENLKDISKKLDLYFEPITKTVTEFVSALSFAPRGLAPVKNSLEYVGIALQTLWRSETGYTTAGIKEIINAFQRTGMAIKNIKSDKRDELYQTLAGISNKDIKEYKDTMQKLTEALVELHKKSNNKLEFLKSIHDKMEGRLRKLSITSSEIDEMVSPIEKRFEIIADSTEVLKEFGGLFATLYSMHLDSGLIKHIDTKFASQVSPLLAPLRDNTLKVLKDSNNMIKVIGRTLPEIRDEEITRIDVSRLITDMAKSTGSRKLQLARQLSANANKASQLLSDYAVKAKDAGIKFIGGISKTIDSVTNFKKKMEEFGKIYDVVQDTIKEINAKKGPISEIGKIKDSATELVHSLKEYDLNKLLSADPKVIPRKIKEMQSLFKASSGALLQINQMLRKCKSCKADKVLGYNYLTTIAGQLDDTFNKMFVSLNRYASTIGETVEELQGIKSATKAIKKRFNNIFQKKNFNVDTLKELSDALSTSTSDITAIQHATEGVVKVLFDKDVNLDIIGGSINNIVNQLSTVMTKSHDVAVKGERVYIQAKKMKTIFGELKSSAPKLGEGPIRSRIELAKRMAAESKTLMQEFPVLFQLTNKTLHSVGINDVWLKKFGISIVTLTSSVGAVLNKTSDVLTSADILVKGAGDIKDSLPEVTKVVKDFVDSPWDKKIPTAQDAGKKLEKVFNIVIDSSIKSANALGLSLTKDDLKSAVATTVGKRRLARFQGLYNDVAKMAVELQKGPISNIGVFTDAVHKFVGSLSDYDFGKMLLQNPNSLRSKFTEFRQLTQTAGDIISDVAKITGLCRGKSCNAKTIFGNSFIAPLVEKLDAKFTEIGKNFKSISKRVSEGFKGWEKLVSTASTISDRFRDIRKGGITKDTFLKASGALLKSADDMKTISEGSSDIFHAIFNGDKDMKVLQDNFEGLVQQVSGVLNKTSQILPKIGEVFQSVENVKKHFHGIATDLGKVRHGPIESRISVLKEMTGGIKSLAEILPTVLNQSASVIAKLGVDSSWITGVAGKMVSISHCVSKVVNKTNIIIDGAGLVVKHGQELQTMVGGISKDYEKIVSAPWNQKLQVFGSALGRIGKIFDKTKDLSGDVQKTLEDVIGKELDLTGGITNVTHGLTGAIDTLRKGVEKAIDIQKDVTTVLDEVKSGPIQKIGKLTDSTKDFIKSIKNYDIADILVLAPKFAKAKIGDLKEIVLNSGSVLKSIGSLVKKHCNSCDIDSIFRSGFVKGMADGISSNLRNITKKAVGFLSKVEEGATNVRDIIHAVKGINTEVSKLSHIDLNSQGFDTISDVLHKSSGYLKVIEANSSSVARMLFNDSSEIQELTSGYGSFITQMRGFLGKAGNFSGEIAKAFKEFESIKQTFKETKSSFKDLTRGPIESRVQAVASIANGVNSIMSKFTEVLKTSKLSPSWLKSFGSKLEGITGGISKVLNRTVGIATDLGATIKDVKGVIDTGKTISTEFRQLVSGGSIGSKIQIAASIVANIKSLTTQVNAATGDAAGVFQKITGITIKKTNIFGDKTEKLLGDLATGVSTIADRYQKFQELSHTIQQAFDQIENDPIKFATEELPKLFNQSSEFVSLIYGDVKGIATKLGFDLDKFHIDKNIVSAAKSFYKFAKSALGTIGSGRALIMDFKNLLHSKSFTEGMKNLDKVMKSGQDFIKGIDDLGSQLFKKWDVMKGSLSKTLDKIAKSTGINIKNMGSYLRKGLKIGASVLNIVSSIKDLLNMKEFNVETVVKAASDVIRVVESGVQIAQEMGVEIGTETLGKISTAIGVVTACIDICQGLKGFITWLKDTCDITYKTVSRPKTQSYICYKPVLQRLHVQIPVEVCSNKTEKVIRGFTEGKLCCPTKDCIYVQDVQCLASNEACLKKKRDMVGKMREFDSQVKAVYQDYFVKLQEMQATQVSVKAAEINLQKSNFTLQRSTRKWKISQWTGEKINKRITILSEQRTKLEKLVQDGKCLLDISKVEFDVTSYDASVKLIPFRIHVKDNNLHKRELDVITNFDKEVASFENIAQLIVTNFTDYIPMYAYRTAKRSVSRQISAERSAKYWRIVCFKYEEVYGTLKNIIAILDNGIKESSDAGNVDLSLSNSPSPSSSHSGAMKQLRETMKQFETGTTENVDNVIKRWQRTSQSIWSEDVGSACIGFLDCFHTQLDDLKTLFEPEMKGYDIAIKSITDIRNRVTSLITSHHLGKGTATQRVESLLGSFTDLNRNAHFCDQLPKLVKQMPLSVFAYVEDTFELTCTIDGPAMMEYIWWKDNLTIPKQNSWKLELDEVSTEDGGYYHCEGKTLTSSVISNRVLVSIYQPMKILNQPEDHVLDYPGGKEVILHCNGTAEPEEKYRWWFKRYNYGSSTKVKPLIVAQGSVLTIKSATLKHTGQYWCELSNGYSSVYSRKSKLDIVRSLHIRESARLHLDLSINGDNVSCALPKTQDTPRVTAALQTMLRSRIGLPEKDEMKLEYQTNREDDSKADLIVDIGLKQSAGTSLDSVTSAFYVSHGRNQLQSLLTDFVDGLKKSHGLQFPWKLCNISMQGTASSIDWRVEELVCPSGMGLSNNLVKCVQCSPGTYDNGKGFCAPCPIGTYQGKAGQTRCYPCGTGMLTVEHGTPSIDDCTKLEYTCDHSMSLVVVLDGSDAVSAKSWSEMKIFITRLLSHMKLAGDAVKLSIVVVGSEAKVEVSSDEFEKISDLIKAIQKLSKVPGQYRTDLALDYAMQLSQSPNYLDQQYGVLFINNRAGQISIDKNVLLRKAKSMKSSGISLFNILMNPSGKDIEPYVSIVSQPVSRHFVNLQDIRELSKWQTVIARSVCSSTPQHRG